ncbi:LLM class flavin-dependent oxidoreductase [Streptomyces sp. NPDC052492]|uniref:LLM class flavin-dependent oxidoreductase n=1 Tax=Streptomyces sp. NPDC052492 TaxID=3365691 RepID=UPI0037D21254
MTDYGHPLSFGLSLDPATDALEETRRPARQADAGGLDHLAVQDHPYQPDHLETWTLLSHLSASTERISFLTDVADLQLRPPALLAKAAVSLDVLTGGRVQLGVGGGAFPDAIASMGGVPGHHRDARRAPRTRRRRRGVGGRPHRLGPASGVRHLHLLARGRCRDPLPTVVYAER